MNTPFVSLADKLTGVILTPVKTQPPQSPKKPEKIIAPIPKTPMVLVTRDRAPVNRQAARLFLQSHWPHLPPELPRKSEVEELRTKVKLLEATNKQQTLAIKRLTSRLDTRPVVTKEVKVADIRAIVCLLLVIDAERQRNRQTILDSLG